MLAFVTPFSGVIFHWPTGPPVGVIESRRQLAAEPRDPGRLHSIARCSEFPWIIVKMVGVGQRLQKTNLYKE